MEFFGAWQKGTELFIAMELCDGASIDRIQEALGRGLVETELAVVGRDSLQGLEYLHKQHTLHRDIKAANLLVNSHGECKLVDFGVSVISEPGQKRMTFIGSPYWMAPEVIDNRTLPSPYDARCDVWSLGVTMLEMADNCVPLCELQPMVALRQIPSRDPPNLREPDKWSGDFRDFLSHCLQKDPDDRWDTSKLLQHPWFQIVASAKPLQELVRAYLTVTKGDGAAAAPAAAATAAAPAAPELPPLPAAAPGVVVAAGAPGAPATSPRPKEDPSQLAKEVEARTDIDDSEKKIILSTLREAQQKNRPTSLRRSIREQDKFVAQVMNQQVVKDQLKQAKKAQEKQEAATKGLQNQQAKQYENLQKQKNMELDKARKRDAAALKQHSDKSQLELANLRKSETAASKAQEKTLANESADLKKRVQNNKVMLVKLLKENQAKRSKTTFANQKKNQLKNKNTKKQVQALHKEQDKEWATMEETNGTRLNNLLHAHQVEAELCLSDFHSRRTKDLAAGWLHLSHLRDVQLVQRRGLLLLEALMREQNIELEFNKQLQAMEIEHLQSLHALRTDQTKSGNQMEHENFKEASDAEFKRLLRVHRTEAKNQFKEWSKSSKNTIKKGGTTTDKAQAKQRTQVEEEKFRQRQRDDEEKYIASVKAQMEKDEKALLEYQKDAEQRLKEFQLREMGKLRKEQEKATEELMRKQEEARAQLRKKVTAEALTLIFTHSKQELEVMIQGQSEDMIQQTNIRNERKQTRQQCGLPELPNDNAWQQQLMDKHHRVREELVAEQKAQFYEVYGKKDDLAETIWSWRNAEDIAMKMEEVVPLEPAPLESPEGVAKETAELIRRQDAYRDQQEQRIVKLEDAIRSSQSATLDDCIAAGKREADELIQKIDAEEEEKLAQFAAVGDKMAAE